ncbi:hypothetical protein IL306_006567 [Fusarium sp. DS 682]|nr:hypothetical protein IL306_006567 [Fusarium sp. DS 682]
MFVIAMALTGENIPDIGSPEADNFLTHVFNNWTSDDPIPMPDEPVYKFSDSALQVGHLKEDIPGETMSANRKKDAKAYLTVKRDGDKTGFLWCDADGEAVDKKYIHMADDLVVEHVKSDLVEMYNFQEDKLVKSYNWDILIAMSRRMIAKFAVRGSAVPSGFDDEDEPLRYTKDKVLCKVTDPEWN